MTTVGRRLTLAACLALAACTAQCHSDRSSALLELVPGLTPEVAAHLVNDSPERFLEFARRVEYPVLREAMFALRTAPPSTPETEFLRVEMLLAPYRTCVANALVEVHAIRTALSGLERYDRCSTPQRIAIKEILHEMGAFYATHSAPVETRAALLADLLERASVYSDALNISDLYGVYASFLGQLDRPGDMPRYLERGIKIAVHHDDTGMACQLLGTLGWHYQHSDLTAMRGAWDQALDYARQSNSWQEARILALYANYYHRRRGQLAIARDLLIEAQDRCRALGATEAELRYLIETMRFLADLNCWEEVGSNMERASRIAAQVFPRMRTEEAELEGARLQVLRAQHAAATGQCDRAGALALEVAGRASRWSLGPQRTARLQLQAARALSECGSYSESRLLLERGMKNCREFSMQEFLDDYSIELASTYAALDSFVACEQILAANSFELGSKHAIRSATLRLKIAMARNDRPTAFVHLRDGLQRLDDMERRLGASAEAYIAISANDELRRLAHEFLGPTSAAAGYAFEMRWRTPLTRRARFDDVPASGPEFITLLAAEARRAADRLAKRGAVHCVFDVHEAETIRYFASASGFTKQVIEVSSTEMNALVQKASTFTPVSASTGEVVSPAGLRTLAKLLLPELASNVRLFLTTANGCLVRLQFQTLNLADSSYVPLIQQMDVAALRFWNEAKAARGDSALVVVEPAFAPSLRRRHSILAEPLPLSRVESKRAMEFLSGSVLLTGPSATKQQVLRRGKRARILYFAGHMLQDPELPYLTFIPMGQPALGHDDDSYLEVADVRSVDLSRCGLVVLSSCASGAPYASGDIVAPSMAEAFLDAGARAAVSTAWPVRDEAAARVMTQFIQFYAQAGEGDPIRPLCNAQRALAAETHDPSIWANYSIQVTHLERHNKPLRLMTTGLDVVAERFSKAKPTPAVVMGLAANAGRRCRAPR